MSRSVVRSLRRAVRLGRAADPRAFAVALAVALLAAAVPAVFVLGTRALVDDSLRVRTGAGGHGSLVRDVLLLALAAGAARVAGAVQSHRQAVFAQAVTHHAERGVLRAAAYAGWASFGDPAWHDRLARANRDITWRPYQLATSAVVLAGTLLSAAGIAAALVSVHPLLVLLCVLALLPALVIQRGVNALLYGFWTGHVAEERRQDYLRDVLLDPAAAQEVRAFGLQRWLLDRHAAVAAGRLDRLRALYARADRRTAVAGLATAALLAAAFGYAGDAAADGRLSPGDVSLVAAALAVLTSQLGGLLASLVDVEGHAAFLDDLFALLDAPPPEPPGDATAPPGGGLRLDGVRFAYPGGPAVLDGVTLEVGPGEVVALVGPSGAGKTTVARLLLGLHRADAGTVSVLGRDVAAWDPAALRASVGVVFQDYARFELPLRDCVAIGRPDEPPDDARVRDALDVAGLGGLAERHGLDAPVGRLFEGGHDLSGGEWQRLALARVAYRDPPVWLLDEPTAGLDAATEAGLLRRLRARLAGRVALVVSHRLTTTRLADRVAVLDGGRVVESGTHDELLAAGGTYARYWQLRDADYRS